MKAKKRRRKVITGDRQEFVGAHVTEEVKKALQQAAAEQKLSMSMFIFKTLQQRLQLMGFSV